MVHAQRGYRLAQQDIVRHRRISSPPPRAGISFPHEAKLYIFPMIGKRPATAPSDNDILTALGRYGRREHFPVKQAGYGRTISLYRSRPSHRIGGVNDSPKGNVLLYTTGDGLPGIEVTLVNDTVWLTADQMATLFQRNKSTISRHIRNVFESGELASDSVVAFFATTATDGKWMIS